jgi:hypothetical protein
MSKTIVLKTFRDLKIGERFHLAMGPKEYKKVSGHEYMVPSGGPCWRIESHHAVMVGVRS